MKEVHHNWPFYSHAIETCKNILEKRFNHSFVLGNIVESELTFNKTLGLQSDIVLKEMYKVTTSHPDAADSKGLVLRPEGTAGILRYVLQNPDLKPKLQKEQIKLWYWGPMFRHERPQTGRSRQFYQIGAELIGGSNSQSKDEGFLLQQDLESIVSAWHCLDSVFSHAPQKPKIQLELNNLGGYGALKAYNEELVQMLTPHLDRLTETS